MVAAATITSHLASFGGTDLFSSLRISSSNFAVASAIQSVVVLLSADRQESVQQRGALGVSHSRRYIQNTATLLTCTLVSRSLNSTSCLQHRGHARSLAGGALTFLCPSLCCISLPLPLLLLLAATAESNWARIFGPIVAFILVWRSTQTMRVCPLAHSVHSGGGEGEDCDGNDAVFRWSALNTP